MNTVTDDIATRQRQADQATPESLRISETRYRRLFEAARDGILIVDVETRRITEVNPFMVELLGYTRDEFLGKELFEIGLLKDEAASAAAFRELQASGYIRYEDLPLQTKWGKRREVEFVSNVYAENGHQVIQCNIRDNTERKRDERDLARLAAIVESSEDAIIGKTLDGIITSWNTGAQTLYGYTAAEAIGRPISFLAPADLPDEMPQLLEKIRRGEPVHHYETVRVRKDGSRFDISLSISPVKDAAGHIIGASSIKRDITQRKRNEASLLQAQRLAQATVDALPDNIAVLDSQGVIVTVNAAWCAFAETNGLLGTAAGGTAAGVGANYLTVCATSGIEQGRAVATGIRAVMAGDQALFSSEYPCHSPGEERWFELRVTRFAGSGPLHVVVAHENITARKLDEARIQASEASLATAQHIAHLGSWEWELPPSDEWSHSRVRWSDETFRILGYAPGEVEASYDNFIRVVHPEDRGRIEAPSPHALQARAPAGVDLRLIRPDGSERDVHWLAHCICDLSGKPIKVVGTVQDITERKRDVERLREREEFQRALLENFPNGSVNVFDRDLRYVLAAGRGLEEIGLSAEQLVGKTLEEAFPPGPETVATPYYQRALNGETVAFELSYGQRCYHINAAPLHNHEGAVSNVIAVAQDITERKRTEEALRRQQTELRVLFDLMPAMIWFKDTDNGILRVNQRVAEAAGKSVDEIEGKPSVEIYPQEAAKYYADDLEVIHSGAPRLGIVETLSGPDGKALWVQTDKVPVYDNDGKAIGIIVMAQDITERKQAEAALRASEERYRSLALATAQVVWTTDAQGQVVEDLPTWRAYTGQSVEEIAGLGWIQAVHPEDQEHTAKAWLDAVQNRTAYQVECRMRAADGTYRLFADRGVPVMDSNGQIREWVGTCTDIAELKQAEAALQKANAELERRVLERTAALERANVALRDEEIKQVQVTATLAQSEERFRLLVESVHDYSILMLDPTGHVMTWNDGAERMKGYRAADIIGQHFACFYTEEDQQAARPEQELHIAATQGYLDDEGWRVRQDGSRFWATVVLTALRDGTGQLRGFAKVSRDITERRNMEDALREAKVQADTANLAKSEFLSRMSHELRTPLNAILGFGQLLAMQDFAPAQQERVQHILKAGRHLLDLINEVLEIARIEAGHMLLSMEPVLVRDTVQEVYALVRPLAAERGIELQGSEGADLVVYVQADRQRLKQVLLNLCSNAIKYNRPQGIVTITCETVPGVPTTVGQAMPASQAVPAGQVPSDQVRINVTDTGMGIAAASQAQLFVPFMRVGAEQTTIEGTGLGLALSLNLMHAMGGTIGVASTVGVGSTFWLQLPLTVAPTLPAQEALAHSVAALDMTPVPASTPRYTLLYIEDNLSNLELIEDIIADQPTYTLLSAMQGQVGLDLARQHHPDLILLDLHLPDVPGDQVLARLRADPTTAGIPVVMLSAVATASEIERLLAAGANAYLTKPLDVQQFLDTLAKVLRSSENPSLAGRV